MLMTSFLLLSLIPLIHPFLLLPPSPRVCSDDLDLFFSSGSEGGRVTPSGMAYLLLRMLWAEFIWLGFGGVSFSGGGVNPLLILICSLWYSVKVSRGVAYMLASLQAVWARGFPFIDMAVGGFGVDRLISSVLVGRLASFLSSLPLIG